MAVAQENVGVKIYCENCGEHQPMRIDRFHKVADGTIWGDICCARCLLVIVTLIVPEEGEYEFRKVLD